MMHLMYKINVTGCNCDNEGWLNFDNTKHCQLLSDLVIAIACFSIPLEFFYYTITLKSIPTKRFLLYIVASVTLCGVYHCMLVWMYFSQSFRMKVVLTVLKLLMASLSWATSVTFAKIIPELLRIKAQEAFLLARTKELAREVANTRRRQEQERHQYTVIKEIRKSLDKNMVLKVALYELVNSYSLKNCMIWMPSEDGSVMNLMLQYRHVYMQSTVSVSNSHPDIEIVKSNKMAVVLNSDSPLGKAGNEDYLFNGSIIAVRLPLSKCSFGKKEASIHTYGILVFILPFKGERTWTREYSKIFEFVANQISVALAHAAIFEESQMIRQRLTDENHFLQRAKQNVLVAIQALQSFQAVMNHEMRTYLHSISALASLLQVGLASSPQESIADMLARSCNFLFTFLNDIINLSHSDDADLLLQLHPFQLSLFLKEAKRLSSHVCMTKGLQFAFEADDGLPSYVIGDEKRLLEVLLCTVGNTGRLVSKGLVSVHVSIIDETRAGWDMTNLAWRPSLCEGFIYLRFEIKMYSFTEHGADAFGSQKDGSQYKKTTVEAGLRFTLCRQIVQLMHGHIWHEERSEGFSNGVTFSIRLQVAVSGASKSLHLHRKQLGSALTLNGLNVLVVDDNCANLMVTKKMLEHLGCQATTASSGFQCLSMLFQVENSFEIVLLDVCMPDMDGYEVAFHITQKVHVGNMPLLVALTGKTDRGTRERCLRLGMAGFIGKPVSLTSLCDELLKVIHKPTSNRLSLQPTQ